MTQASVYWIDLQQYVAERCELILLAVYQKENKVLHHGNRVLISLLL